MDFRNGRVVVAFVRDVDAEGVTSAPDGQFVRLRTRVRNDSVPRGRVEGRWFCQDGQKGIRRMRLEECRRAKSELSVTEVAVKLP
jgi:hypothetical protein